MNTRKWILLVEDNANDADLVIRALRSRFPGTQVTHAEDGSVALDCLHHRGSFESNGDEHPSVVLLDLKMLKVSGLEVLHEIKTNASLSDIPVVVFTSSREEQDISRSYQLGANAYVVKPVEFPQYITALQAVHSFWLALNEPPPRRPGADASPGSAPAAEATEAPARPRPGPDPRTPRIATDWADAATQFP